MFKVKIPGWQFDELRDPSFRLDEERHEYWLQGGIIRGYSGIVRDVNWASPDDLRFYTEDGRYRGTYVHWCTRLDDEGDLNDADVDYEYFGYLAAYRQFKIDWQFVPRLIELPMYHRHLRHGITPDREGLIFGKYPAIVELKTGELTWLTKYQTAAQDLSIQSWEEKPTYRRRIGVKLNADGTYLPKEYKDPLDYERWKCAVVTAQANESKNVIKKLHNIALDITPSI